jgi:hypothetical protein
MRPEAREKLPVSLLETLMPKYLRVRREWQLVDAGSGHRQRLADELARLERTFTDMGVMHFADTQPSGYVDGDPNESAA